MRDSAVAVCGHRSITGGRQGQSGRPSLSSRPVSRHVPPRRTDRPSPSAPSSGGPSQPASGPSRPLATPPGRRRPGPGAARCEQPAGRRDGGTACDPADHRPEHGCPTTSLSPASHSIVRPGHFLYRPATLRGRFQTKTNKV